MPHGCPNKQPMHTRMLKHKQINLGFGEIVFTYSTFPEYFEPLINSEELAFYVSHFKCVKRWIESSTM